MSEIAETRETPVGASKEQVLEYLHSVEAQLISYITAVQTTLAILSAPDA
jgi:hypothetical protein